MSRDAACDHSSLIFGPSPHADEVNYQRPPAEKRVAAAGKKKNEKLPSDNSFPAPLVLPGDDLAFGPADSPQSLLSWIRLKERNEVTRRRNVIYVAGAPVTDGDTPHVNGWTTPRVQGSIEGSRLTSPPVETVMAYLAAFYHGMNVKFLPSKNLHFAKWANTPITAKIGRVGLNTTNESIGIRFRPSPDGIFPAQLNLNDLLDTAINILPDDAYALLMLVSHDLFEDDDDDFCCGRAYGGSRVAVVSTARYSPCLDEIQNVERQHAWPASHCEKYVRDCCEMSPPRKKPALSQRSNTNASKSPLQAALTAHTTISPDSKSSSLLSFLYLSRVCQTASHELGHCFGLGHCVYYACVMQSTASVAEDVRQPPYLCPVDLAKLLRATGVAEGERYAAIKQFCERTGGVGFGALGAWVDWWPVPR